MSDLMLNAQREAAAEEEEEDGYEPRGRGYSLGLPSHGHRGTGKGRFAHRKHQKSKSLCTLETNLDEVGEEGGVDPSLRRVPSVHELRVTKSLQKLNVPDWFKQSSLSKSSSCLLKYGSNSTMNSFSFSPSLISSPCASTAPPAPNVVIKTRVVPPSNPRVLRSPNFSSPSSTSQDRKQPAQPVKLPSEKLREKEKDKNKNLMPIPIVPFAQIRAMFEKKDQARKSGHKKEKEPAREEAKPETRRDSRMSVERAPVVMTTSAPTAATAKPVVVPSISISGEEEGGARAETRTTSPKRTLFDKPPISPTRSAPPPQQPTTTTVTEETFRITTAPSSSFSAPAQQPQTVVGVRPGHRATNGVREEEGVGAHAVSPLPPSVSARTEAFPPSAGTGRPLSITEKPPVSPATSSGAAEPKTLWKKDSQKDAQAKSPSKDAKQQFSPSRSLRQFFGRSKDKSGGGGGGSGGSGSGSGSGSEKKAEGHDTSLDSSFSSGDGVYEKEPRRIRASETSRRFDSGGGKDPRFDHDSSFSSEGRHSGADTSSRSLEGAPGSRGSRAPQYGATFSSSSLGSRSSAHSNSERHQPPYSKFAPQDDLEPAASKRSAGGDAPGYQRRLPGAGTSYGHLSSSSENGEHVPESVSSSKADPATAAGEKKSVKETTV